MRFLLIVTGYNCAGNVQKCAASIMQQNAEFIAVFISDGSTDGTAKELSRIKDVRFFTEHHAVNAGAAKRRYDAIHKYGLHDDVVVLIGMDDALLPGALHRIKREYDAGKWVTYGNWVNQHGKGLPPKFDLYFSDAVHAARSYRKVQYRSTAPNTFYKCLFDLIPEPDFIINGRWIDSTTESEVMFSCLEMAGRDRIGVITEPIYLYNQNLPNNSINRLGKDHKYDLLKIITARPPKPLLTELPAMKVDKKTWEKRVQNLIDRRGTGVKDNAKVESDIADYGRHLRASEKFGKGIGKTVLDIGCGDGNIEGKLMQHTEYSNKQHTYIGVDAFPVNENILEGTAEDLPFKDKDVDTSICFAVLDSTRDAAAAVKEMCRVTATNILMLTGIDIEPDKYHTHNIKHDWLVAEFAKHGFYVAFSNYLSPKVLLIEFYRE